jgi:flagellar biosynthesis protein FlhA
MAIANDPNASSLPGEETREPVFDVPARWIQPEQQLQAETRGHTVVEPAAVIATHISETIRSHAAEILSRQDVADMVEQIREREPAVVTELVPDLASTGQVHQALRELLEEGLSVRDLPAILEALTDGLRLSGQLQPAIEYVRMTQAEAICERLCDEQRVLRAVAISPDLEHLVEEHLVQTPDGVTCALPPDLSSHLAAELEKLVQQAGAEGQETVLLTAPRVRPHLRSAVARSFPKVRVLSYAELAPQVQVEVTAQLALPPVQPAPAAELVP